MQVSRGCPGEAGVVEDVGVQGHPFPTPHKWLPSSIWLERLSPAAIYLPPQASSAFSSSVFSLPALKARGAEQGRVLGPNWTFQASELVPLCPSCRFSFSFSVGFISFGVSLERTSHESLVPALPPLPKPFPLSNQLPP